MNCWTVPAFDSSTRFALAGGALGAASFCPLHEAAEISSATAKNGRKPFIRMSL